MIADDEELRETQQQVARFEGGLLALRNDLIDKHPAWFRLMGSGYVEEIDMLRARIDEYIGAKAARESSPESSPESSDVLTHQ